MLFYSKNSFEKLLDGIYGNYSKKSSNIALLLEKKHASNVVLLLEKKHTYLLG